MASQSPCAQPPTCCALPRRRRRSSRRRSGRPRPPATRHLASPTHCEGGRRRTSMTFYRSTRATVTSSRLHSDGVSEPFVSVAEVAERLGMPRSWVYKQVQARTIPCYKLGHYVRFRPSEIEEWVRSRRVAPTHG